MPEYLVILTISLLFLFITYLVQDSVLRSLFTFLGFAGTVFLIFARTQLDLLHPIIWFLPTFTLYAIAAPIVMLLGILPDNGNYGEVIFLHQVAAVSFILVAGARRCSFAQLKPIRTNGTAAVVVILLGVGTILAHMTSVLSSGAIDKSDMVVDSSAFIKAGFGPNFVLSGFILFIVSAAARHSGSIAATRQSRRKLYLGVLMICVIFLLVNLVTGQRKIIFAGLIAMIMLRHVFIRRFTLTQLVAAVLVLVAFIPITTWSKSLLLRVRGGEQVSAAESFDFENLVLMLSGEHRASGQNLSVLIEHVHEEDFRWGQGTIEEFSAVVLPNFLRSGEGNSAWWFNYEFFFDKLERGAAIGFSLVGFGYLEAGVLGVVLLFGCYGWISRFLYQRGSVSAMTLVFYICFIVFSASCLRQGFAVILSPMLKHVLLPIAIGFTVEIALSRFVRRRRPPLRPSRRVVGRHSWPSTMRSASGA